MKQEKTELSQESLTPRELGRRADEILAVAGFGIFGRRDESYQQTRFEYRMRTGAYCSQKGRHK